MIRDNMSPIAKEILEFKGNIEVTIDNDKANNAPEVLSEIIGVGESTAHQQAAQFTYGGLHNITYKMV